MNKIMKIMLTTSFTLLLTAPSVSIAHTNTPAAHDKNQKMYKIAHVKKHEGMRKSRPSDAKIKERQGKGLFTQGRTFNELNEKEKESFKNEAKQLREIIWLQEQRLPRNTILQDLQKKDESNSRKSAK